METKKLKVVEYNLAFGSKDRFVNILGYFKYKENGNIYVLYLDTDPKYNIIYYGTGHIRNNNVLCMKCKNTEETEIIKEYIFKVVKGEELSQFIPVSLTEVEGIELIGTDKIEVKPEVIEYLNKQFFSIKETSEENKEENKQENSPKDKKVSNKKGKKGFSKLLMLLLMFLVVGGVFYYFSEIPVNNGEIVKKIICKKEYAHNELDANVKEVNTYNFNIKDTLQYVDIEETYIFEEDEYQNFINKGIYYKYLPSDEKNGGYKKDDLNYTFKIMYKEEITTSYSEPKNYEEVINYYKTKGYTCREEIE